MGLRCESKFLSWGTVFGYKVLSISRQNSYPFHFHRKNIKDTFFLHKNSFIVCIIVLYNIFIKRHNFLKLITFLLHGITFLWAKAADCLCYDIFFLYKNASKTRKVWNACEVYRTTFPASVKTRSSLYGMQQDILR